MAAFLVTIFYGKRKGLFSGRRFPGLDHSLVIDLLRGFTLFGVRISKEELRKKMMLPEYLRLAMREAIQDSDVGAPADSWLQDGAQPVEWPMVVLLNSKSGERHGPKFKEPI